MFEIFLGMILISLGLSLVLTVIYELTDIDLVGAFAGLFFFLILVSIVGLVLAVGIALVSEGLGFDYPTP